ncbi:MAG: Yip1 family protein [Bacillota bacterium]
MEMNSGARTQNLFELIYGVLFNPVYTFSSLADAPPLGYSVLILFILAIANALTSIAFFRTTLPDIPGFDTAVPVLGPWLFMPGVLLALIFASFKYLLYGAVLHLAAELWGGKGTPRGTLAVYALAALPGVFLIPLELMMKLFNFPEVAAMVLGLVAGFAVVVWGVVLLILGLREVHRFPTDAAVLTVFTPAAVLILLLIVFFVAVAVFAGTFAASTGF